MSIHQTTITSHNSMTRVILSGSIVHGQLAPLAGLLIPMRAWPDARMNQDRELPCLTMLNMYNTEEFPFPHVDKS
jgi:hypothetical protein